MTIPNLENSLCLLCSISVAEILRGKTKVPEFFVIAHSTDGCQQNLHHNLRQTIQITYSLSIFAGGKLLFWISVISPPGGHDRNNDQLCYLYYLILPCTPHHYVHREVEPSGIL